MNQLNESIKEVHCFIFVRLQFKITTLFFFLERCFGSLFKWISTFLEIFCIFILLHYELSNQSNKKKPLTSQNFPGFCKALHSWQRIC